MKPLVRARSVAPATDDISALAKTSRGYENFRADGIPRTLWSAYQFEREPMVAVSYHVPEQCGCRIHIVQNDVDVTVVEKVAKRRTPRGNHIGQATSGRRQNFLKLGPIEIAKQLDRKSVV